MEPEVLQVVQVASGGSRLVSGRQQRARSVARALSRELNFEFDYVLRTAHSRLGLARGACP
jgi:hypothetical protein